MGCQALAPLLCCGYQWAVVSSEQIAPGNVGHRSRRQVASTHDASQSACSAAMGCMGRAETGREGLLGSLRCSWGQLGSGWVLDGGPPSHPFSTCLLLFTILEGRLWGEGLSLRGRGDEGTQEGGVTPGGGLTARCWQLIHHSRLTTTPTRHTTPTPTPTRSGSGPHPGM